MRKHVYTICEQHMHRSGCSSLLTDQCFADCVEGAILLLALSEILSLQLASVDGQAVWRPNS